MNTTTTITTTTTLDPINQLARAATAGTLKRIYTASANDNIRKLQASLQADFSALDNGKFNYIVSDAYDLYTLAYTYLHEQIIINQLNPQTEITITLKNGTEKTRTVYQWACVLVRKEVYNNKAIENNGKFTYLEDLTTSATETAETALDHIYVRMGKYNGISTDADYDSYTDTLQILNLNPYQESIVKMRMQGLSVTTIGDKLGVSQQAISKQLFKIQTVIADKCPDMIRHFKGQRNY